MATFIARAAGLSTAAPEAPFADVPARATHAGAVDSVAQAGITPGLHPRRNRYCPRDPVSRQQMASFLRRPRPVTEAASGPPHPATTASGRGGHALADGAASHRLPRAGRRTGRAGSRAGSGAGRSAAGPRMPGPTARHAGVTDAAAGGGCWCWSADASPRPSRRARPRPRGGTRARRRRRRPARSTPRAIGARSPRSTSSAAPPRTTRPSTGCARPDRCSVEAAPVAACRRGRTADRPAVPRASGACTTPARRSRAADHGRDRRPRARGVGGHPWDPRRGRRGHRQRRRTPTTPTSRTRCGATPARSWTAPTRDGNGFVDDVHGWNFVGDPTAAPRSTSAPSEDWHGTAVASLIAAQADNRVGMVGAGARRADHGAQDVLGVGDVGRASLADMLAAFAYAADNGADVINASWFNPTDSRPAASPPSPRRGCPWSPPRATTAGTCRPATSGSIPANYTLPNLVTVTAVGPDGRAPPSRTSAAPRSRWRRPASGCGSPRPTAGGCRRDLVRDAAGVGRPRAGPLGPAGRARRRPRRCRVVDLAGRSRVPPASPSRSGMLDAGRAVCAASSGPSAARPTPARRSATSTRPTRTPPRCAACAATGVAGVRRGRTSRPAATVTRASRRPARAGARRRPAWPCPPRRPTRSTTTTARSHERAMNQFAALGILRGEHGGGVRSGAPVTRGQLAALAGPGARDGHRDGGGPQPQLVRRRRPQYARRRDRCRPRPRTGPGRRYPPVRPGWRPAGATRWRACWRGCSTRWRGTATQRGHADRRATQGRDDPGRDAERGRRHGRLLVLAVVASLVVAPPACHAGPGRRPDLAAAGQRPAVRGPAPPADHPRPAGVGGDPRQPGDRTSRSSTRACPPTIPT